ncbi:ABC transporter permease [Chitinimonas sp. BJB300]|uniref:ABC transporter permease n=1 Tax=Chitinimonas sp. BJB300 TaxID=1559339 RepID=UPI000C0D901F|nr:ABC transporter permease [Chitinimonas sp. BJB300]PHV10646.1 peptide ABC transporter permease [Chitinimonas sp. BJB300]TSJ83809.1 ABC transporter permease [Chitinimonas sp. BJB300]
MTTMTEKVSPGFWRAAGKRLWADKLARGCLFILAVYFVLALASTMGWLAKDWNKQVAVSWAAPTMVGKQQQDSHGFKVEVIAPDAEARALDPLTPFEAELTAAAKAYQQEAVVLADTLPLGADKVGRDIGSKVIKAAQTSITVGLLAALLSVAIGTVFGAVGGYFGGRLGDALEWLYSVFTSMPYILLVLAFASVLGGGVHTVILVLGFTGWTGTYRLIRSEYIKQRSRDYVLAASAIGASDARKMFLHILPNVSHLILVQLSQDVVNFIKAEVILSFLGFGVPVEAISWGIMINEVMPELVLGKWWQLATVATVMSLFVVAFGLFTDQLRDALDPKASRR